MSQNRAVRVLARINLVAAYVVTVGAGIGSTAIGIKYLKRDDVTFGLVGVLVGVAAIVVGLAAPVVRARRVRRTASDGSLDAQATPRP